MMVDQITVQPVLNAERIDLRPLRKSDRGLIELYAGDERVARNTRSLPHPLPPGSVESYIARSQSKDRLEDVWALDGSRTGLEELLGVISLRKLDRDQCEIAYWVAPAFWNTGFASEAVRCLVEANPQNCRTMFAEVFQSNPVSARVLTNAGFEYLGDAEAFSVAQNSNVPTWTYTRKMEAAG